MHNTMLLAALDLAEEDSSPDEDESGSESDADGESASQSGSESAASQSSAATQSPMASLRAGQRNCDATGVAYPLLHAMEMKHGDNLHSLHSLVRQSRGRAVENIAKVLKRFGNLQYYL